MIWVLVHYTENWLPLTEATLPNLYAYCRKHNYELDVRMVEYGVYDGKEKLKHVIDVLKEDGDVALVLDADTLVTNRKTKIENFLEDDKDFYITYDVHGLNAGSFIVRKSAWSDGFLNWLLQDIGRDGIHCEQDAISKFIKIMPIKDVARIKVLDHPSINSLDYNLYPEHGEQKVENGQWVAGCFLLHVPAIPIEKRIEIFKNTPIVK